MLDHHNGAVSLTYAHIIGIVSAALSALACLLLCAKKAAVPGPPKVPSIKGREKRLSVILHPADAEMSTAPVTQESTTGACSGYGTRSTEEEGGEHVKSPTAATPLSGMMSLPYTGGLLTVEPPASDEMGSQHSLTLSFSDSKRADDVPSPPSQVSSVTSAAVIVPGSQNEAARKESNQSDPSPYDVLPASAKSSTVAFSAGDPSYAAVDPVVKQQASLRGRRSSTRGMSNESVSVSRYSSATPSEVCPPSTTPPVCVSVSDDPYAEVASVGRPTRSLSARYSDGAPELPAQRNPDSKRSRSFCVPSETDPVINESKKRLLSVDLGVTYALPQKNSEAAYSLPHQSASSTNTPDVHILGSREDITTSSTINLSSQKVGDDTYAAPCRIEKAGESSDPSSQQPVVEDPYAAPNLPNKTPESMCIETAPQGLQNRHSRDQSSEQGAVVEDPYAAPALPVKTADSMYIERIPKSLLTSAHSNSPSASESVLLPNSVESATGLPVPDGSAHPVVGASSHHQFSSTESAGSESNSPIMAKSVSLPSLIDNAGASSDLPDNYARLKEAQLAVAEKNEDAVSCTTSTTATISEAPEDDDHYAKVEVDVKRKSSPSVPRIPSRPSPSSGSRRSDSAIKRVANAVASITSLQSLSNTTKLDCKHPVFDKPIDEFTVRRSKSARKRSERRKSDSNALIRTRSISSSGRDDPYASVVELLK